MILAAQTVVKNHFQYGPYILVMIPIMAAATGAYVKRITTQRDLERTTQQTHVQSQIADNTRDIISISKQLTEIAQTQGERIARLEGMNREERRSDA